MDVGRGGDGEPFSKPHARTRGHLLCPVLWVTIIPLLDGSILTGNGMREVEKCQLCY